MLRRALVLAVLILLTIPLPATPFSRGPKPMTAEQASQAGSEFAWDLYRELSARPGNLFFSPASIDLALVMTWTGARGQTAQDMGAALKLGQYRVQGPDLVSAAYGELQASLVNSEAPHTLRIANRLWGQKSFRFRDDFLDPLARDFNAGLQELDFAGDTETARRTINTWVEEQTEDKIQNLLPEGALNPDTRLVLTNAVYFLGQWQHPFQGSDTTDRTFFLKSQEEIQVPTMSQSRRLSYGEDDQVQILALPYQGGEVEMLVILPRQKDSLAAVEKELDGEKLAAWTANLAERQVQLYLPKFTLTGEFSLSQVLGRLGMGGAFGPGADFSGMTGNPDLFISEVIHKSFVDVYEKGTEAAAATAVNMRMTSMPGMAPDTTFFRADHPFLFLIRHTETGSILFLGRVNDPRG